MPFQLTAEQQAIRDAVRAFGESEIRPVAAEYEAEQRYPADLIADAADLDLVAPHVPEAYGGAGMDPISTIIVTEELWRADPGVGGSISAADFGTGMLVEYGDERQCEEWLPRITTLYDGTSEIQKNIIADQLR
ncbi:acyl-CoA dehydrogenase family protein [Natrinema salaciae]|uniref:Acyl-CoA dehydrogenase, N-terminal domain n=1 Tax=Natrinema salaciae TaxID=1186196 RepID=A0A1H9S651_9EURY|nr:acyl-CoA dehydrogenase family protein [Natrinema salaciae]SER80536.1 Acyl-CoA dehydrogenase, N-terminal domain [Natrinema salaciae]